jgi:hypothetical protein
MMPKSKRKRPQKAPDHVQYVAIAPAVRVEAPQVVVLAAWYCGAVAG